MGTIFQFIFKNKGNHMMITIKKMQKWKEIVKNTKTR